jgi:O-antigen ligase
MLFTAFCVWTFVVLVRPQDLLPVLAVIRPALVTGALTLILVFIRSRELAKASFLSQSQNKLYAAFFFIMILGIPFSLYPRESFMVIFTDYLITVVFCLIFFKVVTSTKKLLIVLLLASLGIGLYSAFSLVSGGFRANRLYFGGMFDPNDLPFFVLSFLPFNFLFMSKGNALWKRIACAGSFVVGTLLIVISGSRGGMIGFGAAMIVLFLGRTRAVRPLAKIIMIVLCLIFLAFNASKIDLVRYQTIGNVSKDYNALDETGRLAIWKIGMRAMVANPLTGVGVGCFNQAVGLDRQMRGLPVATWQAPHNMLVQIGTETGFIGLFLFVVMSFGVFRVLRRAKKAGPDKELLGIGEMGTVGFVGHLVSGMFLSQAYSVYWALYIVMSAVLSQLMAKDRKTKNIRSPGRNNVKKGVSLRGAHPGGESSPATQALA